MVDLDGKLFKSNKSNLVLTNLENMSYSMTYYVCIDIDGISYSMMTVIPSGVINDVYVDSATTLSIIDKEASLTLYGHYNYDLDGIILISSSGEEIKLTSSDFTYNEEYNEYTANISFKDEFEFITVIGRCAPFKDALNELGEYPGSMYMEFELTFENEGEY
jgi:hypothetical protein